MDLNRLEAGAFDAALHLLDRQVVDTDGLMVCNVDDLEVTDAGDGHLAVTGILVGPAALWPRLSGTLGHWLRTMWIRLGVQYAARDVPMYIPLDHVGRVGSAVILTVPREGLLDRQPGAGEEVVLRRFAELLGMAVEDADGEHLGAVLDARLTVAGTADSPRWPITDLVVGRGRPGTLLGYDRGDFNGPWLVHRLVVWLHRHSGELPLDRVEAIDWDHRRMRVAGPLEPLSGA